MKHVVAPLIGLLFAAMLLAPTAVLFQFKLDQARIAKELCVQRELMEEMRTCHGECQLTKRFKALEQRSEAGFPAERLQVRFDPVVDLAMLPVQIIEPASEREYPEPVFRLSAGVGMGVEHVPRG